MGALDKESHEGNDMKESQGVERRRNAAGLATQPDGSLRLNSPCHAESKQAIGLQVSCRKLVSRRWPLLLACVYS